MLFISFSLHRSIPQPQSCICPHPQKQRSAKIDSNDANRRQSSHPSSPPLPAPSLQTTNSFRRTPAPPHLRDEACFLTPTQNIGYPRKVGHMFVNSLGVKRSTPPRAQSSHTAAPAPSPTTPIPACYKLFPPHPCQQFRPHADRTTHSVKKGLIYIAVTILYLTHPRCPRCEGTPPSTEFL